MPVIEFPSSPAEQQLLIGPISYHQVIVEGRAIPLLTGRKESERETLLIVDRRFGVSVPDELAHKVAWLLANAIAVASGYACLSAESKEQPFAPKAHLVETEQGNEADA